MKENEKNREIQGNDPRFSPYYGEDSVFYDLAVLGNTEEIIRLQEESSAPADKAVLSENPVRNEQYHLVASCMTMASRCIDAGMPREEAYKLSDTFIRKADACNRADGVREVKNEMVREFSRHMGSVLDTPNSYTVRRAINFICDNLDTKLTVNKVAEKVGYNRSHLSDLFRKETGCLVSEYILRKRVEAAKGMIESGVPLSEISKKLRFSTQSHFCERFRIITGMTPGEYRRRASK